MSVEAISAVLNHSVMKGTARSVAICLADHADRHGVAWPAVSSLAAGGNCSRRSAQYALRAMQDAGELEIVAGAEGGRNRTPLYRIVLPGLTGEVPRDHPHYQRLKGANPAPTGTAEKGANGAPIPEPERAQGVPERAQPVDERAQTLRERVQTSAPEPPGTIKNHQEPPGRAPRRPKVNRRPVTDAEYRLATEAIEAFNLRAGTSYSVDAHLTPIVGRIREHPDLAADDHRAIIAAVFERPWWDDRPGPQVIYGNRAQFERCIEKWRAKPSAPDRSAYDAKTEVISV